MSNTNPFTSTSVVSLQGLTYELAEKLIQFLNQEIAAYPIEGRLYKQRAAEEKLEQAIRNRDNDARKERERILAQMIENWVVGGECKPGTYLKMKGCRDGKGIRLVMSVKTPRGSRCSVIECRQVNFGRGPNNSVVESLGQITEHMSDKITQVRIDNGLSSKWFSIRCVVEGHRDRCELYNNEA